MCRMGGLRLEELGWLSSLLLIAWRCTHAYAPTPNLTSALGKTQGGRGLCSLELPVIRRLPATAQAGLEGIRISFAGYANRVPSSWGSQGTRGPGRQSGFQHWQARQQPSKGRQEPAPRGRREEHVWPQRGCLQALGRSYIAQGLQATLIHLLFQRVDKLRGLIRKAKRRRAAVDQCLGTP